MDIVLILKALAGLVVLLAVLIFFFFYVPNKKQKTKQTHKQTTHTREKIYTLSELIALLKDKHTPTEELQKALNSVLKYHGEIPPKRGIRVDDAFYKYSEVILRLCRHPNTTKDLILNFDKELRRKNPAYDKEINDALTKGINSRGM